jgi:hypothetical protein
MIIPGIVENEVVSYVVDRYQELKDARASKEEVWLQCLQAYLCDFPEAWKIAVREQNRSGRFYAIAYDAVNTVHSQLASMIFPRARWLYPRPAVPGRMPHDDEASEEVGRLIDIQKRHARFENTLMRGVLQLLILGNCPWQVGWRIEHMVNYPAYSEAMRKWDEENTERFNRYLQQRAEYDALVREAARRGVEPPPPPQFDIPEPPPRQTTVASEGPTFEICDTFDTVLDAESPDPRRALRIRKYMVSRETLRQLAEPKANGYRLYENVDAIEEVDKITETGESHYELRQRAFNLQPVSRQGVMLKEAQGTMEIENALGDGRNVFVSYIATVANDKTLIRFEPTYFWSGELPLQWSTYIDLPGHVYGLGLIEPFLGLQDLINARANQMIDATAFAISPEYKFVPDGLIQKHLKSAPGKGHPMRSIENMQVLDKDFRGIQIAMNEIQQLVQEFRGMTRSLSPLSSGDESATKTALDANIVGTDLGQRASHIEEDMVGRALNLWMQLNAQYLDEDRMARMIEDGDLALSKLSPEKIRQGWVIEATGSRQFADRAEQYQNLMMWGQMFLGNQITAPAVKISNFMRKAYELLGFDDTDDIIRGGEEAMQILDRMMQSGLIGGGMDAGQRPEGTSGAPAQTPSRSDDGARSGARENGSELGRDNRGLSPSGGVVDRGRRDESGDQQTAGDE